MTPTFEDRLLTELESIVDENAPAPRAGLGRRAVHSRSLRLAVAGVAAATISAVLLADVGGGGDIVGAQPAWAVDEGTDGMITIRIHETTDPEGLKRRLAELGIRSDVTYLPYNYECSSKHRWQNANTPGARRFMERQLKLIASRGLPPIEIRRDDLGPRDALVVDVYDGGVLDPRTKPSSPPPGKASLDGLGTTVLIATGPVQPCEPVKIADPWR